MVMSNGEGLPLSETTGARPDFDLLGDLSAKIAHSKRRRGRYPRGLTKQRGAVRIALHVSAPPRAAEAGQSVFS
jgi:hypothetical protein